MADVTELPERDAGDGLTVRQRRVLEVIRNSVERRGYPPSMREIGQAVDFQQRVARERLGLDADVLPGGHLIALSHPDELAHYVITHAP